jgi:DNA-binding LacI/PurR family transcriptional regulator
MVTMQQVADRARVSISTVSFVVNGTKPVTAETRDRVLTAIDELGYRRNAMARALATRRSRIIALLHPIIDRNMNAFVESAATAAAAAGYSLVLWPLHTDNQAQEVSTLATSGMAEGVLLLEVQFDDERVTRLEAVGAPYVLIGRTRELAGRDYVDIDFESTIATVVDRLVGLGHRHLALVVEDLAGTELADYAPPLRTAACFEQEVARHGIHGAVFPVPNTVDPGAGLIDRIAEAAPETTAVLIMPSDTAFGIVHDLRRRGLSVPRDLSIVLIAASAAQGALVDPPLTTYQTPAEEMGARAAQALIARLEGTKAEATQVLLPCLPVPGESLAQAPERREPLRVLAV